MCGTSLLLGQQAPTKMFCILLEEHSCRKSVVLECQRRKNEIISKTCNNHTFLVPFQV